jgi:hypothetical protein
MIGAYAFIQNDSWTTYMAPISNLLPPLACVIGGFYVLKQNGIKKMAESSQTFIIIGLTCWFLGEFLWTGYEYMGITKTPSLADFFFLFGYFPLTLGFLREIMFSKTKWSAKKMLLTLPLLAVLGTITINYGIIGSDNPELTGVENAIGIFYGIGDFVLSVLVTFVLVLVLEYRGRDDFFPWFHLLNGMIITLVADILYSMYYTPYIEGLWPYKAFDFVWALGYLFFAYALFSMGMLIKKQKNTPPPPVNI